MTSLRNFVRSTWVGRLALIPWRLGLALKCTLPPVGRSFVWAFTSREHHNFTYALEELNVKYLISFVAAVTGRDYAAVESYMEEIQNDTELKAHVLRLGQESKEKYVTDATAHFGRRMGWYCIVRAMKPRLCVETGTDKGLGTCVLAAALRRNAKEGFPGKVLGMDLNPNAGYLLRPPYDEFGQLAVGDSHASIRALQDPVDLFIHDSDHTPEHEAAEFKLIEPKLSPRALVLSDNAEVTEELLKFARSSGRRFFYFAEQPRGHWARGGGIGVAVAQ